MKQFIDWCFRLAKYSSLVLATLSVQHGIIVGAILLVVLASIFDYLAQYFMNK